MELVNVNSLFDGVKDFFAFFPEFYTALPLPVRGVLGLAFGGFILLMLLRMLVTRG